MRQSVVSLKSQVKGIGLPGVQYLVKGMSDANIEDPIHFLNDLDKLSNGIDRALTYILIQRGRPSDDLKEVYVRRLASAFFHYLGIQPTNSIKDPFRPIVSMVIETKDPSRQIRKILKEEILLPHEVAILPARLINLPRCEQSGDT